MSEQGLNEYEALLVEKNAMEGMLAVVLLSVGKPVRVSRELLEEINLNGWAGKQISIEEGPEAAYLEFQVK